MKRFSVVQNGYDVDEVNKFIDIVIGRLEKLNTENTTLQAKIEKLNTKTEQTGYNDEKKLEKAILAIQETSDRMREVAKEEASIIVDEAKNNANSIIHEALIKAEQIEQERLLLEKNIKIYKERVKNLIQAQLKIADDLDSIEL